MYVLIVDIDSLMCLIMICHHTLLMALAWVAVR